MLFKKIKKLFKNIEILRQNDLISFHMKEMYEMLIESKNMC